eukprot:TRINITY_DN60432_c0_g1_i1.p1 TRINITY_DN60432_c0_g1~~TRINITY_DN60432_c0_g1_i1.p1  ORF type:complete len:447 (+),score=195.99 TRINITY_DN60432_c0_g1_i1:99-1343(+)
MSRFLMPRNTKSSKKRAENNRRYKDALRAIEADIPLMRKYDTNGTGKLERDQLVRLLTELPHTGPAGEQPTEAEVDYILKVADLRHNNAINIEELPAAISAWQSYQHEKPSLERFLAKHDENKSGGLSKDQMRNWLRELNHDEDVTDSDVDYIWQYAHVKQGQDDELSRVELGIALNLWVHHQAQQEADAAARAAVEKRKQASKGKPFARFLMPRLTKMSSARAEANRYYNKMLQKEKEFLQSIDWDKYDLNKTGQLEPDQLKKFLTDTDFSTPPGTEPTDWELNFILQIADERRNGAINKDELQHALTAWMTYQQNKKQLDRILAKYDQSGSSSLTVSEVQQWLTDLNEGQAVPAEEAEVIVQQCEASEGDGELRRTELLIALQVWYCGQCAAGGESGGGEQKQQKSGCCVLQ